MSEEHRKTKVINPSYQYRAAYMTTLAAIIVVNFFIVLASLSPKSLGVSLEFSRTAYYVTGILEVALIFACWRWTINSTHRIAGPVYAIDRELRRLREGDLSFHIELRPKDEFHESVESINASISHLRDEISAVKAIAEELESSPSADNIARLKEALDKLKVADVGPSPSDAPAGE